jgi:fructokinase
MILSCGEALIDMLPRTAADGAPCFQPFVGGSPFNTAIALGRLGARVGFYGGLSRDVFGASLKAALVASNVDIALSPESDRPTTLAFVVLVDGDARYAFYDENSAARMLAPADLPALPAEISTLHFSAVSLVQEPCGSAYEALVAREHGRRVISLDPNVRPSLIRDRAPYLARIERLMAMADVVKLSEDDLRWLAPGTSFADFADARLGDGPSLMILTRGEDGATAITRRLTLDVPGRTVTVADTVGAGDTFTAGLHAWLQQAGRLDKGGIAGLSRDDLAKALDYAVTAASITVSRPGADPPWRHEMPG